jgi:hypothetical protein
MSMQKNGECAVTAVVPAGADGYEAPRTAIEQAVAAIWAELLGIERVGVHDNFLLLGGESLLAVQAGSRIRTQFDCEVTMRSIFVQTVAEVAADIHAKTGSGVDAATL